MRLTNGAWMIRMTRCVMVLLLMMWVGVDTSVLAQRNRRNVRASSRNTTHNSNRNVNRNVNRNTNVNVNRHVDVDVHHRGGCCYHSGWGTAAAVATTAVVTAAVVGSRVRTLPPACSVVIVNGFSYQQCGSTWYQPQLYGGSTTYVVVNSPR